MVNNSFDCKVAIEKGLCKGDCCGCVPIDKKIFQKNKDKLNRPIIDKLEFINNLIVPVTSDGMCCFLQDDYNCGIYDDRPDICMRFGTTEKNIHLACPHLKPSGRLRSDNNKNKILRLQNKATKLKIENIQKW